jgi:hypothetical protein
MTEGLDLHLGVDKAAGFVGGRWRPGCQPESRSTTMTPLTMSCTPGTRPLSSRRTIRNTSTSSATPSTAAKAWTISSSRSTPSRMDRGRRWARPWSTGRRTARTTSRRSDSLVWTLHPRSGLLVLFRSRGPLALFRSRGPHKPRSRGPHKPHLFFYSRDSLRYWQSSCCYAIMFEECFFCRTDVVHAFGACSRGPPGGTRISPGWIRTR